MRSISIISIVVTLVAIWYSARSLDPSYSQSHLLIRVHTIEEGDTYSNLSKEYDVPVETLIHLNPDKPARRLKIGDEAIIQVIPRNKQGCKNN